MTSDDMAHYRRRAFAYGTTRGQLGFDQQKLHDMISGCAHRLRWLRSSEQFPRFDKCHSTGFEGCGNFMRRPRRVAG
jgi:hypothetical protein